MPGGAAFMARVPDTARAGREVPMSPACDDRCSLPGVASDSGGTADRAETAIEHSAGLGRVVMSLRSRSSVVSGILACLSATRMAAEVGAQCRAEISEQLPAGPDAHS